MDPTALQIAMSVQLVDEEGSAGDFPRRRRALPLGYDRNAEVRPEGDEQPPRNGRSPQRKAGQGLGRGQEAKGASALPSSPQGVVPKNEDFVRTVVTGTGIIGAAVGGGILLRGELIRYGLSLTGIGDGLGIMALNKPLWEEIENLDMEISTGTEAQFEKHMNACPNRNGHLRYKPIKDFTIMDLPAPYRDRSYFDFLTLAAEVVAQVVTTVVSKRTVDMPLHPQAGQEFLRAATGWFYGEYEIFSKEDCPCPPCKASGERKKRYAVFNFCTARMFIFDNSEAERAVVKLFYSDEDEPEKISLLYGMDLSYEKDGCDWVLMRCCTHDERAIMLLSNYVSNVMKAHFLWMWRHRNTETPLMIFVCHPHGRAKHIACCTDLVQRKVGELPGKGELTYYLYGLPTCRGMCGAPIRVYGSIGHTYKENHLHLDAFNEELGKSGVAAECEPKVALAVDENDGEQE